MPAPSSASPPRSHDNSIRRTHRRFSKRRKSSPPVPERQLRSSPNSGPSAPKRATSYSSTAPHSGRRISSRAIESGRRQARAVARRPDLDAKVTGALVARDEIEVLAELAGNPRVRLEGAALLRISCNGPVRWPRITATGGSPRRCWTGARCRPKAPHCSSLADPFQRVEILLAVQRSQLGRPPGRPRRSLQRSSTNWSRRPSLGARSSSSTFSQKRSDANGARRAHRR